MHGGLPDFEKIRRDFIDGTMKWSSTDAACVTAVRQMAEVYKFSAGTVAAEFSVPGRTLTRSAVIGLARRCKPEVIFQSQGNNGGGNRRLTRRARIAASGNLSTHYARLQSKIEARDRNKQPGAQPFGYMPFESAITGGIMTPASAAKIAARRNTVPRCMWAGCGSPELENPAKDCYCPAHKRMARK